jgi:hypothetical protein
MVVKVQPVCAQASGSSSQMKGCFYADKQRINVPTYFYTDKQRNIVPMVHQVCPAPT